MSVPTHSLHPVN
jgi:hypothetical protein